MQLDIQGRCRTGKMMLYDPETGHRIKDKDKPGPDRASHSRTFLEVARYISPEHHAEVEALVRELGLEFWREGRVGAA